MDTNLPIPDLRPVPGSDRQPAPRARDARPVAPDTAIEATLMLRRRTPGGIGADPADLDTVTRTLGGLGLRVVSADGPSRRVRVRGTAAVLSRVFGTRLDDVTSDGPDGRPATHRHRTGDLAVPVGLDGIVTAVLGLDDRPQARAQLRIASAAAVTTSYTPPQLGTVYAFPPGDGSGRTIAIIELGGGFAQSDLDAYFAGLGIAAPVVTAVGVDGAANQPGADPLGADGEVLPDIEVAGALCPGAQLRVYFAPNTDAGFVDAVSDAVHAQPTPTAISISWGQSEDSWTAQARDALDSVFADAVTLGAVVTAAAGDHGSSDGVPDGRDHADFPASSPHVLACGGTSLHADPVTGHVTAETVWNDGAAGGSTGGGVSDAFPMPSWQRTAGVPGSGRGVPDVAAVADPRTGYQVLVDGSRLVIGGTSAVAPLWAALMTRLAQASGAPLGPFTERLYAGVTPGRAAPGFRDIVTGTNGAYAAGPGWDACTGLGVPDGTRLLARLTTNGQTRGSTPDARQTPGLQ
jgi:kumamolisin